MVQGTTLEKLEEYISSNYYAKDGKLLRRNTYKQWRAHSEVGTIGLRGYKTLSILGKRYYVHRVLYWIYHTSWPALVDHEDTNKLNNCKSNLRELSKSQNGLNISEGHRDSELGCLGILKRKDAGKFSVRFQSKSKGCYNTLKEAKHVYDTCRNEETARKGAEGAV